MNLRQKKCVPCEGGVPPLGAAAIEKLRPELDPHWLVIDYQKLGRVFKFKDFKTGMAFVNRVAGLAETESHHPDILINYNLVTLTLWTHALGGLSENDFILASKIDALDASTI